MLPRGLFATPDYVKHNGVRIARIMTAIVDGCSVEEAREKPRDAEEQEARGIGNRERFEEALLNV